MGAPEFEQTYAAAVPELSTAWRAAAVSEPRLLIVDGTLIADLGLDAEWFAGPEGLRLLVGDVPDSRPTYAQGYAGHQFGSYSPVLGDGRALLLGEFVARDGVRRDLHLKGSGRTPYARGGDGLAVVGPMLREYLMGVAMQALGIPTTRALAVVATGDLVRRERPLPGAILARVARSHLRVGTVQYAAASGRRDLLRGVADHAIDRHHPAARESDDPYLALLESVARSQASLVAQWMSVGFVHGVMNTDNTTLSGETIDYGPCAFIDVHDPRAVFSSIDHRGRYAYGNQPVIIQWNLARLAEALLPLIGRSPHELDTLEGTALPEPTEAAVEAATDVLVRVPDLYDETYLPLMARKLGIGAVGAGEDLRGLVTDALGLLSAHHIDHTRFFRALANGAARELFTDPAPFDAWSQRRGAVLLGDAEETAAAMRAVNPHIVPRNHVVEDVLTAATEGDLGPFERVVEALRHPFEEETSVPELAEPAPSTAAPYVTYCGT